MSGTAALLFVSSILQIAVALVALRAPRSSRTRVAWWLFAAALLLMALRRLVALGGYLAGAIEEPTRPAEELLATITTVLLFGGIVQMRKGWKEADLQLATAKRLESERRESEELWHRVFEFAPDGYILLELDGRLEKLNHAAAEIAGLRREDAEGRHIFETGLFDEEGMQQAARNLAMMQQGHDPGPAEYTFHRPDGTERQVEVIGYIVELGGRPVLLTIVHDITRRRRIEAELRSSRLRLEEAQRVAGVVTFEIDLRRGTMWVSNDQRSDAPADSGSTEMSLDEGFAFIVPEDRERVVHDIAAAMQEGGSGDIVVEYRQHDGLRKRESSVRTTARAEKDADGNVVRLIGATVDLTEIRLAENEVRTLNAALEERVRARTAELERAVDELEAFSYAVAHDLRSPLRAMAGYSELVVEENGAELSESSREHLERIRASSVRMASLIDGLLSLSRLTRAVRNDQPIDLAKIARGIVGELRETSPERQVEVVIEDSLPAVADSGMMQLLMQNLLANAWKFTRNAARPRIEVGRNVAGAFYVRDNGVGFDASRSSKLFRPFERLHRTDEFEGTGIGLATVARIVRRHGGRVWAEGHIGRGATFWFTLGSPSSDGASSGLQA